MSTVLLDQVMSLEKFRGERQSFYPSNGSLSWYIRVHKARLVESGALLLMRGAWHAHAERFDEAILEIAAKEAAQSMSKSGARAPAQAC